MLRIITAAILILHGFVHILGFLVYCQISKIEGINYKTTILADKLDIGHAGTRIYGVFWLLITIAFIISGVALILLLPWWQSLTLWITILSLIITTLGWPDSRFGVFVNIIILIFLFIYTRNPL
jgi:hypothetical protein